VVAYDLSSLLTLDPFIWFLIYTSTWLSISNTNLSIPNHVHLIYFLVLIVYYKINWVVSESSWNQASCKVINESIVLLITSWIFCVIKESSVFIYHISIQILNSYFRFYFNGKVFDACIWLICKILISIKLHVKIIIVFDCPSNWWWDWLPISESLQT